MLWTILPIAIVIAALAYVALAVRRARGEHRARSEERAALLLTAMHGRAAEPEAGTAAPEPASAATLITRDASRPGPGSR